MSLVKLRAEKDCLNCGNAVEENFCPKCGQENIIVKEDAFKMVTHAIADYFHFEHKFFGTIIPLLFKPGQLTKQYVAGKRASFIHPIRLYIFISIIFFISILGGVKIKDEKKSTKTTSNKEQKDSITKIKTLEKVMSYVPAEKRDSILKIEKKRILKAESDTTNWNPYQGGGVIWDTKAKTVAEYEKDQLLLPKNKRDGFIKHYLQKKNIEFKSYPNPKEKFSEDLMRNIPKMMFVLLPLFALLLKLVYITKKKYYFEHLIYSFHLHSAIFLSVLLTMLFKWLFGFVYDIGGWLSLALIGYIIWYIYRSLRTFYGSTRWITILKIMFLSFFYNIFLLLCVIFIAIASFLMI